MDMKAELMNKVIEYDITKNSYVDDYWELCKQKKEYGVARMSSHDLTVQQLCYALNHEQWDDDNEILVFFALEKNGLREWVAIGSKQLLGMVARKEPHKSLSVRLFDVDEIWVG